ALEQVHGTEQFAGAEKMAGQFWIWQTLLPVERSHDFLRAGESVAAGTSLAGDVLRVTPCVEISCSAPGSKAEVGLRVMGGPGETQILDNRQTVGASDDG